MADYCYFDTDPNVPGAILWQHRPWRPDHPVQFVRDTKEAAEAANAIGCLLR